jgi:hypothetical protein
MDILAILAKLDEWRNKRESAKEVVRRDVLKLALQSCHALVEIEDVGSDTGILLQKRVRELYRSVSTILDGRLGKDELKVIVDALGSARIFYWVKMTDLHRASADVTQLVNLLGERGVPISDPGTPSHAAVQAALADLCSDDKVFGMSTPETLISLRRACLRDFAALEVLALKHGGS